jgi:hypothetical protein
MPNVSMRLMSAPACSTAVVMRVVMTEAPATVSTATTASTAAMRLRRRLQSIRASTPPATDAAVSQGRYHGTYAVASPR